MSDQVKYVLDESRLPEAWYNIAADLPSPPPPVLHPGTGQPVGPDDLAPLFPMAIIGQEVSTDRLITIPEEVRSVYRQWRPTPLYRARRYGFCSYETRTMYTSTSSPKSAPANARDEPHWPAPVSVASRSTPACAL